MAGVVGFVSRASGKGEARDAKLAFGGIGIRGGGGEDAARAGEEKYVVSARGDF